MRLLWGQADKHGAMITNPILPGFNPDPSICRVGDDFFIATSTFEWFGGVLIHHSRDLVNWRLGPALNRVSQVDMRGNPSSGGGVGAMSHLRRWPVLAGLFRCEGLAAGL